MPVNTGSGGRGAERLGLGRPFVEYPLAIQGAIGLQILPFFPVGLKKAAFSAITRESILRERNVSRQDKGSFSRDSFATEDVSYDCKAYGHEQTVGEGEREVYANDFDADDVAQQMCRRILDQAIERRIAAAIFNTTTWPSGTAALYTDVSTDWDSSSATITADIEGAKQKVRANCGLMPNTLVVGAAHLKSFKLNTIILSMFPGVDVITDALLMSALPAIFGIPKVLIGGAVYNAGGEGAAFNGTDVWSDDYCWIGVTATGQDIVEPCVGRTATWDKFGGLDYAMKVYGEDQTNTDVWQLQHWTDEKIIDPYFGHLLVIDT